MTNKWLIFAAGFTTLAVIALAGLEYLGKTRVDPVVEDYRRVQDRHLNLFEEDQQFLAKFEIFRPVHEGRADAGPFLNPRLPWSPSSDDPSPLAISFSPTLTEKILRLRSDWMRHHARLFKNEQVDLTFFKGLAGFDHWDIERNSPLGKLIDEGTFVVPEQLPVPGTIDLLTATKLRLAWGAHQNDPLSALREVRSLARLLLTTEHIQLFSSGLAVLDLERLAYRYFVERGHIQAGDWEPVPRNITRRASRAVWATRGFFHIWTTESTFEKVFLSERTPVGLCEAINEGAPKELSLRPLLTPRWPFERDFREPYARLDRAIERANKTCRLRYLTKMIELNRFESDFPLPGFFTALPYSRKIFGLRIATLPFIGFEAYDSLESQ